MSKTENKPFCYSFECTGLHNPSHAKAKQIETEKNITICPKCGHSVMWRRVKHPMRSFVSSRADRGYYYAKQAQ